MAPYLYWADVLALRLDPTFVETPEVSGGNSIIHSILLLICFDFIRFRKERTQQRPIPA